MILKLFQFTWLQLSVAQSNKLYQALLFIKMSSSFVYFADLLTKIFSGYCWIILFM